MGQEVFSPGNVAVITGAGDGIGLAAAQRMLALGMKVVAADIDQEKLDKLHAQWPSDVYVVRTDVSRRESVAELARFVAERAGPVSLLFNNAGVGGGGDILADFDGWKKVLDTNLLGFVNVFQNFLPAMLDGNLPGVVVSTGSKQGITNPPRNTAYNVSKAGIKSLAEGVAHTLREHSKGRISSHLLIPGFTYTGMIARHVPEKPASAWSAEQVVEQMLAGIHAGDFYIWCEDNETPREVDMRRLRWAVDDIVNNRPPLSRWHPDFVEEFDVFLKGE